MTDKEDLLRWAVLEAAQDEVGVVEEPGNKCKYNRWFFGKDTGAAWCCTFVMWCFNVANIPFPKSDWMRGYASVPNIKKARKKEITKNPLMGDLVIFEFNGKPEPDHIGIFSHWVTGKEGKLFYCVEGNTSKSGSQSNGGEVCLKERSIKSVDCFISPREYKDI